MKRLLFFYPLFLLFLISSCGKLVSDKNPDFIGTWTSTDFTNNYILVIESDNSAAFYRLNMSNDTITTNLGTAKINSNDMLIIGNLKLKISEYPNFDSQNGVWVCTLENWPFVRQ
ncbi:MAG: hypothetical protein KDC84_00620 [Crocinitomicaceae bacterium]|nr:hypothetical protein [Crocinitomicaceae bacterium]